MISEEQLTKWEHQIDIGTLNCYQAVPKLIAEVRELERELDGLCHDNTALELRVEQLEKEAEYLAGCIEWCPDDAPPQGACFANGDVEKSECIKCWRKRAVKAVKNV